MSNRDTGGSAAAHLGRMLAAEGESGSASCLPFDAWAQQVPEPKAGRLDFGRFPFQRELYQSGAEEREIVIKKATQVGVSAMCIRWAMYWADRGLSALYVFPKQRQLRDFSDARIKPMIRASAYLRERVSAAAVQNNALKQIGRGYLYLRGSESVADLQAVDADVLVLDEYDGLVQDNIPDAERRLGASDLGFVRRVGVPSYPGFGVAAQYERSDRRQWYVHCTRCNLRQPIAFANIDTDTLERVCTRCRDALDVRNGEWVAEFPDRDVRGYHIPRLIVPNADLGQLVRSSTQADPARRQAFVNKDLGEEYAAEDARLAASFIEAAQRPYACPAVYSGANLVTMGVDVASVRALNVRVSEHLADDTKQALFIGEVEDFAALDGLMERFRVHMCAIDSQPERRLARGFAERFAGRVYLVTYASNPTAQPLVIDAEQRRVTVCRTDVIDATLEILRRQRNLLPLALPASYVRHLQAAVRVVEPDAYGRMKPVYRSLGADDFLHAEAFDFVARELADWHFQLEAISSQPDFELVPIEDVLPDLVRCHLANYEEDLYGHGASRGYFKDDGYGW